MSKLNAIIVEAADPAAAERFYVNAFGLDDTRVRVRGADGRSTGFRGFTVSLIASQPANVDALIKSALDAGATTLKPAEKTMWGYGAVVQAPDGAIWKVATSSKKDIGPGEREFDELVLLLGATDIGASKRFYVDQGFAVDKSFGKMYAQFDPGGSPFSLGLYRRKALAKDAGVAPEGDGPHGIVLLGAAGPAVDPDGFALETASA